MSATCTCPLKAAEFPPLCSWPLQEARQYQNPIPFPPQIRAPGPLLSAKPGVQRHRTTPGPSDSSLTIGPTQLLPPGCVCALGRGGLRPLRS